MARRGWTSLLTPAKGVGDGEEYLLRLFRKTGSERETNSRANRAFIRKMLLTEWDPIGVLDIPEARDEYDAYADTAFGMLANHMASVDAITQYLFNIARAHGAFISRTC